MEAVMIVYRVPTDVADRIYEMLHALNMRDVFSDQWFCWRMNSLNDRNDRGYTVRNFFEFWNFTPRYYDHATKKIYGSFRRNRCIYDCPL